MKSGGSARLKKPSFCAVSPGGRSARSYCANGAGLRGRFSQVEMERPTS